jgi:hypothetical protein
MLLSWSCPPGTQVYRHADSNLTADIQGPSQRYTCPPNSKFRAGTQVILDVTA